MNFNFISTAKKTLPEADFIRAVMIGLTKDDKSPSDIMSARFGKVKEYTVQMAVMTANVEVNYSGSVGYDRQEQYQTTESKRINEGERYTCKGVTKYASTSGYYDVDVVKTRTVTDWQPHSGVLSTKKMQCVDNGEPRDVGLEKLFISFVKNVSEEDFIEEGTATISASKVDEIKADCELAARWEVKWPGDHQKDERYSFKTDVESLDCYILPCYEVEFEYEGKSYKARGIAAGEPNEVHEVPTESNSSISVKDIQKKSEHEIYEAEKPLKKKKVEIVLAVLAGIVGFIGLLCVKNGAVFVTLLIVGFALMLMFIILAVVTHKKVKKAVEEIRERRDKAVNDLKTIKVDSLIKALNVMGLPALTTEEKNSMKSN